MVFKLLKGIFNDKSLEDDRQPILIFQSPFGYDTTYGILAPSSTMWIQLSMAILISLSICSLLAVPVYLLVVKRRGSMTSFLAGFGAIIPFALYVPFHLVKFFDVRNTATVTALMWGTTMTSTLRCVEAMYGFSPPGVENSLGNYCLYFGVVITEFIIDDKTGRYVKSTTQSTLEKLKKMLYSYLLSGLLLSVLSACSFSPFNAPIGIRGLSPIESIQHVKFIHLFHPGHILNNLSHAALHSVLFYFGSTAQIIGIGLATGNETKEIALDPLSKSISPSDFWSRRWNCFIAGLLKRGIFKPTRKYYSKLIAALVTFTVSGLLHEFVLCIMSFAKNEVEGPFAQAPKYGAHICFFLWNGIVLVLEGWFGDAWIFQRMRQNLPQPIITALILGTALPVTHWFTHEYIVNGAYVDTRLLHPMIIPL